MLTNIYNPLPSVNGNYNHKAESQRTYAKKLREACSAFESLFIHYILKTMRSSIVKCEWLHQDNTEDVHMSLFDQAVSAHLAKGGGIGIGEMLYRQLVSKSYTAPGVHTYNRLKFKPGEVDIFKNTIK